MEYIDNDSIQQLLEIEASPAVTLYIPMLFTASPPHIAENQVRVKNMLHHAVDQLRQYGDGLVLAEELLKLQSRIQDNAKFWESQTRGMLICAAPGMVRMFHLPIDTEEYIAIDDHFHLAPVLALLSDYRPFYVLALAQHNPKAYQGNMYGLSPVDVQLPADPHTEPAVDGSRRKTENQGSATGPSLNTGWFNGRGGTRNAEAEYRMRFYRKIDKALNEKLDRSMPLIVAGVDTDVADFKKVAKYPTLLQKAIIGNQQAKQLNSLFRQAHAIAWQELVLPEHRAVIEEYNRLHGVSPERVAHDKDSVAAAAEQGRVDKLLASLRSETADTVQGSTADVLCITFPEPDDSRIMNRLATTVYRMSGKVIGLLPNEMPNGALMVAHLRY